MTWRGKRVLVTGAGGFIGSHLTERLVELGATTRALVHYNALGSWGWLDQSPVRDDVTVVVGDVRDRDGLREAMNSVEIVYHLAALVGIPYSYRVPSSYIQTNIVGALNVLQVAREFGVGRVVHTSTSEVYGTARYVPIDEGHPLQAQSPYAASKIGADKMAEAFRRSFDLPVVTVRPFNTFGPRQSERAVLPTILRQCLAGGTVRLGNLRPTRDLNFVANIVDGFILAGSVTGAVGQTINLGSGREISIQDLAELVAGILGRPINIETDKERVRPAGSEVERLLADNTLARTVLGWEPTVDLGDGVRRTLEWVATHSERFRNATYAI